MKLSKASNYALHSLVHIALYSDGMPLRVEDLAGRQQLSATYLSKILTKLVKAGLIESSPGVNGGYRLLRPSDSISFLDVVSVIENDDSLLTCTISHSTTTQPGCLIESAMDKVNAQFKEALSHQTIGMIIEQATART